MKKKNYKIIIPARYASKRLPGKPLIKIEGVSMIVRTCIQCSKAVAKDKILVATDNIKIVKECNKYGFKQHSLAKNA